MRLALVLLAFTTVMAALINGLPDRIPVVSQLAHFEKIHILMHLCIFTTTALMIGMQLRPPRDVLVTLAFLLIGTMLIEGVQAVTLQTYVRPELKVIHSLFDLLVNSIGTVIGMIVIEILRGI